LFARLNWSLTFLTALFLVLAAASCTHTSAERQQDLEGSVDSVVSAELTHTRAIDNHAHPARSVAANEQPDRDFDALPADVGPSDPMNEFVLPAPMRPDNPIFSTAWHELYGFAGGAGTKPEAVERAVKAARQKAAAAQGERYPVWILNKLNTDIMLANRVSMGKSLPGDRFKWVPFADMFLFPLNNENYFRLDPDHRGYAGSEERLLHKSYADAGLTLPPATFDEYLSFVSHQMGHWKSEGAVAVKFELAYLRDLNIANPTRASAERVYALYSQSSQPTIDEYRTLQDFLFHFVSSEAGRLGLAVHIHCAAGFGSYFRTGNGDPTQLDEVFNDPALRKTTFVLLHGGWPYTQLAAAELMHPNVYVDLSGLPYFAYPREVARSIRNYLEMAPGKVLFGSDASPLTESIGWEETAWANTHVNRLALGLALTGMIDDGEITRDRAKEIVKLVLRENARALYRF
jgi:uncharacterized protein